MEDVLVPLGFFAVIVGIVWLRARVDQDRLARQAETAQQLLAKFQSGRELAEFMETESGQQFMRQFESKPRRMVIGSLAAGVVFVFLGLGFLGLAMRDGSFLYPGIIVLSLGIGLIVAAAISKRLSSDGQPDSQATGTGTDT